VHIEMQDEVKMLSLRALLQLAYLDS